MTLEGLVSFISKIKETTDQLFLVGQNIRFDVSFFEEQCPIFLTFFERYHIDISNFAILAKMTGLMPEKNSISLAAQAKYFAIKNENPHSSIEDVRTTVGLLREYKKLFQKQL